MREDPSPNKRPAFPIAAVKLGATLALMTLAIAGNHFNVTLFFGVDLLFGSVAALLALVWLGTLPALAVAVAAGAYTWVLWGHPYAFSIFALEIAAVAWQRQRALEEGRPAPPLGVSVALYWILIGIPLALVFYKGPLGMGWTPTVLIALKQALNGLLNAALAGLILTLTAIVRQRTRTLGIADLLFTVLLAGIVGPSIGILAWSNADLKEHLERDQAIQMRLLGFAVARHLDSPKPDAGPVCCNDIFLTLDPRLTDSFLPGAQPRVQLIGPSGTDERDRESLEPTSVPDLTLVLPAGDFTSRMARWRAASYRLDLTSQDLATGSQILVTITAASVIQHLQASAIALLCAALAVALGAVLVAHLVTNWLSRSLIAVLSAAQGLPEAVKAGSPEPIRIDSPLLEIGALNASINAMGESLASSFADLQTERQRLANVIEGTHAGAWEWVVQTDELRINTAWAGLLGYDLAELTPATLATWKQLAHPDDRERTLALVQAQLRGEIAFMEDEFRMRHKDGHWVWIYSRGRAVGQDGAGAPRLFSGIHLDISKRKAAELELAESRQRFEDMANASADWLWEVDARARYTYVSQSVMRVLGYSAEELMGRSAFDVMSPEEAARVAAIFADYVARRAPFRDLENICLHRDGHPVHIETTALPLLDSDGHLLGYRGLDRDVTQKRLAELALAKNQKRLRALIDTMPDLVWMKDPEGVYLTCNPRFESFLGTAEEEILGKTDEDVMDRERADFFSSQELMSMSAAEPSIKEQEISFASDGHREHLLITKTVVHDADGTLIGMLGIARDITERMRLESRLRQLSLAVEQSPEGIIITNLEGDIDYVNDAFIRTTGYSRAEVIGQNPRLLKSGQTPPKIYEDLWTSLSRGEVWRGELINRAKDGRAYVQFTIIAPIRQPDGRITHYLGVQEDVTEKKQLAEELDRHRHHLEELVAERTAELTAARAEVERQMAALSALVRHSDAIIVIKDLDLRVIATNPAFAKVAGYSSETELIGKTDAEIFQVSPDTEPVRSYMEDERAAQRLPPDESILREEPVLMQDGRQCWYLTKKYPIYDHSGRLFATANISVDITERRELENRLVDANAALLAANTEARELAAQAEAATRAKGNFLANMSHEIRTPMNAVLGLAHLLEQQSLPDEARGLARKIHQSGRNLLGIINDILDFSKIESGRIELERVPFRLGDVLDNLATIMTASADGKGLDLAIQPPESPDLKLFGDPLRLSQILINLAGNAIKFTREGLVVVQIEPIERTASHIQLRFSVRDTGIGIDPDAQARLFQPFSQADASMTRRFGGTGLGLAISHRLAELMGGRIGVESRPGEGSIFWLELGFDWIEGSADALPGSDHRIHLLVADDNALVRKITVAIAEKLGWSAGMAQSGDEALRQVLRDPRLQSPDAVVLLDWQMPGGDGLATAQAIHDALPAASRPLLLLFTKLSVEKAQEVREVEAIDGILSKPLTTSALHDAVRAARRRRLGEAANERPPVGQGQRLSGLRLLVVDDSEINLDVSERIFASEGAEVHLLCDGDAAVRWLSDHPDAVDLVFMDVHMPILDGCAATRLIRKNPEIARIPIVALTADVVGDREGAVLESGMDAFLSKPFDVSEAVALILRLMGDWQGRRAVRPDLTRGDDIEAGDGVQDVTEESRQPAATGLETEPACIDLERGLAVWGDFQTYHRYLCRFVAGYAEVSATLAEGEPEAVRNIAHKLKGTAANLGLVDVSAKADELERILASGAKPLPHEREIRAAALEEALTAVAAAIARIAPDTPPQTEKAGTTTSGSKLTEEERSQTTALLEQALSAFEHFDPMAASAILERLPAHLPADQIAAARRAAEEFDAPGGIEAVRALGASFGMTRET